MRDIDAKIRTHEANAKSLGALETRVTDLQALHGDLLARSREVSVRHDQIAQADQELHGRLNGLRDEVQRTVKRFELETRGLAAVGQRILDLRGSLTDMETRCRTLDESSRTIGDVRSQADGLTKQLGSLSETVAHLETQTEHLGAVQGDAEQLAQTVEQMTQRVARLEKAQPSVEAALRDFASLKGTHEEVKDALERMRVAEGEVARVREAQAGTKTWLDEVTESVAALRGELAAVEEMKPTVESVRADSDRLSPTMAPIESRRQPVEQLDTRLTDLTGTAAQLDERTEGLAARMNTTDQQFQALTAHAVEAACLEKLVPTVVGTVGRVERRITQIDTAGRAAEGRAPSPAGLAVTTRELGMELQVRQGAPNSPTQQFARAPPPRAGAAPNPAQVGKRARQLTRAPTSATERHPAL